MVNDTIKASNMIKKYEDVIKFSHPTSKRHPRMTLSERAAQFSPFAALTGYNESVKERERLTKQKIELADDERQILDVKLHFLQAHIKDELEIRITYFEPDLYKEGGRYITKRSFIKKIDAYNQMVIMKDNTNIPIKRIIKIEGEIFDLFYGIG